MKSWSKKHQTSFKNVILLFHDIFKIKMSVATPKEVEYAKNKYKKVDKPVPEK